MHSVTALRFCLYSGRRQQPLIDWHTATEAWTSSTRPLDHCLCKLDPSDLQYLLLHQDVFTTGEQLAPEILQYFQIPQYLFSDVYRRSNGFFASKESLNEDRRVQSSRKRVRILATEVLLTVVPDMWFRVLVKTVSGHSGSSYKWHEMTFCFRWELERGSILCIGVDPLFQSLLQDTLHRMWSQLPRSEPCSLLVPLMEVIIAMYDRSVWSIRDVTRRAEKNRALPTHPLNDFILLHEAARHAIHCFETLSVSVTTVRALQRQASTPSVRKTTTTAENASEALEQIRTHIEFQMRMLQNLLLRSQSNKERLQNEIALAHNMIAQRDSQVMTDLGKAARQDSGAMRTIAVVTMAFLPPTFLSVGFNERNQNNADRGQAIFSTSFFDYTPGHDGQSAQWSVSEKFWVYWAFAIPLTCLTMGTWFWRQKQVQYTRT